jgi:hypothetical protein
VEGEGREGGREGGRSDEAEGGCHKPMCHLALYPKQSVHLVGVPSLDLRKVGKEGGREGLRLRARLR